MAAGAPDLRDFCYGELETIQGLIPKKEFYLIQRDLNVSKKCILSVEPEQYVLSTSKPAEQTLYFDNVECYGFDAGVRKTVEALDKGEGHNEKTF